MASEIIQTIVNQLESHVHNKITLDDVASIKDQMTNIQVYYEEEQDELTQKIKKMRVDHKKKTEDMQHDYDELIETSERKLQREKDQRIKNDLIWKGKILVRQLSNNMFYNIAMKYKEILDKINNDELSIQLKRPQILGEHLGAKLAMAILCDKIVITGLTKKICQQHIDDNDEMHPKCKPLKDVLPELELFKTVVSSLTEQEQIKHRLDADIVSQEIELFKKNN